MSFRADSMVSLAKVSIVLIAPSLSFLSAVRADVWSDYTSSYQNYMDTQMELATQATTNADQQLQDLQKKAQKLKNQQSKDSQKIQDDQSMVKSLQTSEAALEAQLAVLQKTTPPPPKKFLFLSIKSTQQKQIENAENQLASIRQQLAAEQDKQSQVQTKASQDAEGIDQDNTKIKAAQALVDQKNADLQKLSTPDYQALVAQDQARSILDAQRQNTFDTKLLFTDLQTLQQKNKLTQLQAQTLQQLWDTQLNGTLMGEYVNNQIKKAMASTCDPTFQNACAAGKIDALNGLINSKLNAPLAPASAQSTGGNPQSAKDARSAVGTIPSAASPATGQVGQTNK